MRRLRVTLGVVALVVAICEIFGLGAIGAKIGGVERALGNFPDPIGGLRSVFQAAPFEAALALGGALLALALVLVSLRVAARASAKGKVEKRSAATPEAPAVRLLALLQAEGRLVDFLQEDISGYGDAQVAAAARAIHEGLRRALAERVKLSPVLQAQEGEEITVERGFDPAAIRVTGNVRGDPPYRGVLRHPGWRSEGIRLPRSLASSDPNVIAPAEVEIP